jgi:hypothetical protein
MFGIYLGRENTNEESANNGEITLGAPDPTRFQAPLNYIPQSAQGGWVILNVLPGGV